MKIPLLPLKKTRISSCIVRNLRSLSVNQHDLYQAVETEESVLHIQQTFCDPSGVVTPDQWVSLVQLSNYGEQSLIPLEEFKTAEEPSQSLRVALVSTLHPGLPGDLVLKSAQTVLQHLQTSVGQSKLEMLHLSWQC